MRLKHFVFPALIALLLAVLPLCAAGAMQTSEQGITFIKAEEGFARTAHGGLIGYGCSCPAGAYPDGITEEEADALLRETLARYETALGAFAEKHGITLMQHEFDALISFTMTVGSGWTKDDCKLTHCLKKRTDDTALVNALGVWCRAGGKIAPGTVDRRLREAALFLSGSYDRKKAAFNYVIFDAAGGKADESIVYYQTGKPYGSFPSAAKKDAVFAGWKTASGRLLGAEEAASKNRTVTAVWKSAGIFSDTPPSAWYYQDLVSLTERGIIGGYPDGGFHPAEAVSAAAALKLILLASGVPEQAPTDSHYASGYLAYAAERNLLLKPVKNLDAAYSRLKVAVLCANALGLAPDDAASPFADCADARVTALYHAGIFGGSNEGGVLCFRPDAQLTRAELVAVLARLIAHQK